VDRNKHFNDVALYVFIKQKTKQVKPCSLETEKSCDTNIEPYHKSGSAHVTAVAVAVHFIILKYRF